MAIRMRLAAGVLAALLSMLAAVSLVGAAGPDDQNCSDFPSQAAAQAHLREDPSDPDQIDGTDDDGLACEGNPAPYDLEPVQAAIGPYVEPTTTATASATATATPSATPSATATPGAGGVLFGSAPPPSGGFGTFSFGGGNFDQLLAASMCPKATSAFFFNKADGTFAVWIPGTEVAIVNAEFESLFPSGIPSGTIFIARCV